LNASFSTANAPRGKTGRLRLTKRIEEMISLGDNKALKKWTTEKF
jgi:hypothetical protein